MPLFNYSLKGKQVILLLDDDFLPLLNKIGIEGHPLVARVHSQEEHGLWLSTDHFPLCPVGVPQLYDQAGELSCRAHVFLPAKAILSVVAFPGAVSIPPNDANAYQIGFRLHKKGAPAAPKRKKK